MLQPLPSKLPSMFINSSLFFADGSLYRSPMRVKIPVKIPSEIKELESFKRKTRLPCYFLLRALSLSLSLVVSFLSFFFFSLRREGASLGLRTEIHRIVVSFPTSEAVT